MQSYLMYIAPNVRTNANIIDVYAFNVGSNCGAGTYSTSGAGSCEQLEFIYLNG